MRVVLIPVAHGYGTTSRCLSVAHELRRRSHETLFACSEELQKVVGHYGFASRSILDIKVKEKSSTPPPVQAFEQQIRRGFLEQQLKDVLSVIDEFQAEAVVFSHNNVASLAAAMVGIPSVSIFHPSILEFQSFRMFMAMFKKWRLFFRLRDRFLPQKNLASSLFGDLNFIPSIPQLIRWPLFISPEIMARKGLAQPIGALTMQDPEELPPRAELRRMWGVGDEPFIYATLGGAILSERLVEIMAGAFRGTGCTCLITAGNAFPEEAIQRLSGEGVRIERFVPYALRVIKACDVLIWHGGHETMLESVACGTPAVGLPYQYDQNTNVTLLEKAGAGIKLSIRGLQSQGLYESLRHVLIAPSYREGASHLRQINDRLGGVRRLVSQMEEAAPER